MLPHICGIGFLILSLCLLFYSFEGVCTTPYEIDECWIPIGPTVVVSFPGFVKNCEPKNSRVLVLGASEAIEVLFTILGKISELLSKFQLQIPPGVTASLTQPPTDSTRYYQNRIPQE